MRFRTKLAVCLAKIVSMLIRMLHLGNGEVLSGYAAQLVEPDILSVMSGMVREKIIVVMGTNGKTTTNSILRHVLTLEGKTVVSNQNGANMLNGITAAFVLAAGRDGLLKADYACIEVDENESVHVLAKLKPDYIVVTNISRDQLDRYGEVDFVRGRLKTAISSVPDAVLILNCDDAFSYTLSQECGNTAVSCGISGRIFDKSARAGIRESIFCCSCGTKLEYAFFHYGQLGIWRCPCCGAERPKPDHDISDLIVHNGIYSFYLDGIHVNIKARSAYNVYNTLSAYAALHAAGADWRFADAVERFDYGNNRENVFCINQTRIQLHLAKNPVGFQQKLSMIKKDPKPKDIIIQINDTFQDGKDISWLWDVDFQYMADASLASVTVGGTRRCDMGLRLKYEDIPYSCTEDIYGTVLGLVSKGTGNVYMIVNYSGLYPINRMLAKMQKGGRYREAYNWTFVSGSAQFIR